MTAVFAAQFHFNVLDK